MNEPKPEETAHVDTGVPPAARSGGVCHEFPEILRQARGGEEPALNELIQSCREYLLLVANQELGPHLRRKVGPSDLVQSACLLAHKNIRQFRGTTKSELLAWLRVILRNEIMTTHRHFTAGKRNVDREDSATDGRAHVFDGDLRTPSTEAILREEAETLREALGRLTTDHRRVILLRNWERVAFDDIATRMGRSTDAVRKLWSRAIQQLRKEMKDEAPGDSD